MERLTTRELTLDPLAASDAEAMFEVLADPELYRYLDDSPPPSVEHLRSLYARLASGRSPDGRQLWLNWIVRPHGRAPIGYVQATVTSQRLAWVAYVLSTRHGGRGHATQATRAVVEHLAARYGVTGFRATVEAQNRRSIRLLERLGFREATEPERQGHGLSPTELLFVRQGGPGPESAPPL